ncbi:TetR/AcrR family transcriptional regulator [Psychromonas ossibalaenae]|uniref:TetR/AcrR family transcriptional regulator n=1 Tax=Psychromonas ossibalaenae TaxID=444922 RepID=UPI00036A6BED|nr:TetR/AcrR family transcriptional regulator [Psychromonas ossibalaenae]
MNDKRDHISCCAMQVLKESGCAGFSIENVAVQANLELSTVLLYFKNKEILVESILISFVEQCTAHLKSFKIEENRHADKALNQFFLDVLEYRESDACAAVFKELWAVSLHNKELRLVLDQYYRELYQIVFQQLQTAAPEFCDELKIDHAVCFVLPFMEGYSLTRSTLPASVLFLSEQLSKVVKDILFN